MKKGDDVPEYRNGQIPDGALAPIPGGRLRRDAAAAFNAMSAASERAHGVTLRPEGPLGSYRDLAGQRTLYAEYRAGTGNLAAVPGTSNHGWGLAVDFPQSMWGIVEQIGAHYGWSKRWSDAPSEPWHVVYKPGVWHGHAAPVEPPAEVALAQQLLRTAGAEHLVVDGRLDAPTVAAVRELQRRHGLTVDGVPGPKTIAELRRLIVHEERDEAAKREREAARVWREGAGHGHAPTGASGAPAAPALMPAPAPVATPQARTAPARRRPLSRTFRRKRAAPAPVAAPAAPVAPAAAAPADPSSVFPLNRVVAFLGPYIAILSGVLAAWLGQNFPGLQIDSGKTTEELTTAGEFAVGAILTWALHHKYLDGWQKWEAGAQQIAAAGVAAEAAARAQDQ